MGRDRVAVRLGGAFLLLCLLVGPGPATAPSAFAEDDAPPSAVRDDPTAYAADGTWPQQDGCPARTRATRTRAPEGELEVAWTHEAPAPVVGDPRVADGRVVLGTSADAGGVSWLEVLRLADGKPLAPKRKYEHGLPVHVGAWRDLVVATSGPEELEALRVRTSPTPWLVVQKVAAVFDPVVLPDGTLVVTRPDGVARVRPGSPDPLWEFPLRTPPIGPPSVRGDLAYVCVSGPVSGYQGERPELVAFDLARGTVVWSYDLGWDDDVPRFRGPSYAVVGAEEAYVVHPRGFRLERKAAATAARIPLERVRRRDPALHYLDLLSQPVAWGGRAMLRFRRTDGREVLVQSDPASWRRVDAEAAAAGAPPRPANEDALWRYLPLAEGKRHRELCAPGGPAYVADGVATLAGGAFDAASLRIVRLEGAPVTTVRVPVRETLLEVSGRTVTAWRRKARREAPAAAGPRLRVEAAPALRAVPGGVLVTFDGEAVFGDLTADPAGGVVTGPGKLRTPLADVGLLLDRDGRVLHGPDPAFVVRALGVAAARRQKPAWLALARKAVATRAAEPLRRAVDDALAHGATTEELQELRKELARLEKPQGAPPKPVPAKIAEVEAAREELRAAARGALDAALATLPDDVPLAWRAVLFRAALAARPDHPGVVAWLRPRLPAGFEPGAQPEPADWIDLIEACAQTPITVIARKEKGEMTLDERTYASLRATWRPDLVALRSDRLLLVTPVGRPSRIARCLSLGELVCSTLDAIFEVPPEQQRVLDPLAIQLFETQEEYVRRGAAEDDEAGRAFLTWTAGHYDPGDQMSRLYVPPGDDRFDGVLETLAHELTHHWLDTRMPPPAGVRRGHLGVGSPGYALEEGFATFVEELVFDLEARTFSADNPRADSLDAVASAASLLDWTRLLETTPTTFRRISKVPDQDVPFRWTLGAYRKVSAMHLFYAQGAAVCHWLWHLDGGKRRGVLREWVRDLHANRLKPDEVGRRLGMSAPTLGAEVVHFAKRVTSPVR